MSDLQSILTKFKINLSEAKIDNVQWQTQSCNKTSILFYKFNEHNQLELDKFNERISKSNFRICITNESSLSSDKVFGLGHDDFQTLFIETIKYFHPVERDNFKLYGITGTNGKTTTVDLLRQILTQQGVSTLTIGTLGIYYNDKFIKTFSLTSPSLLDIFKTISEYQNKVDIIAVEVSSHALDQGRFGDLMFDDVGWTNLSQDHLDYHQTMENYFLAKYKIFDLLKKDGDCYLPESQVDLIAKISKKVKLVKKDWKTDNIFLAPKYNQDNMAIAKSIASSMVDTSKINYEKIKAPPGRFNIMNYKDSYVVIDFAHSPDGLRAICSEIKNSFSDKKLITLFGCGGDRDKSKRMLMGQAASEYSDKLYLTSDNPRFEEPIKIIEDIQKGVSCDYQVVVNRAQAIELAIKELKNSVLLIAGKGHENYIDQKGKKTDYSDLNEVERYLDD